MRSYHTAFFVRSDLTISFYLVTIRSAFSMIARFSPPLLSRSIFEFFAPGVVPGVAAVTAATPVMCFVR